MGLVTGLLIGLLLLILDVRGKGLSKIEPRLPHKRAKTILPKVEVVIPKEGWTKRYEEVLKQNETEGRPTYLKDFTEL